MNVSMKRRRGRRVMNTYAYIPGGVTTKVTAPVVSTRNSLCVVYVCACTNVCMAYRVAHAMCRVIYE